ncbi:hypothetical protein [Metapseudomonas resinovorans]|uniref:hypothetical protein n=1 Tax=Metapseudomonas resinovorans TaxID=53412 RepID=UPI0012DC921B|nr:hypothetical protein [Pseudomonas resinovorans]
MELERLSEITAYQSQPFTLVLKHTGQRYTPDFAAELRKGCVVIYEIKTDLALTDPPTRDRLLNLQALFALCGYPLEIICESRFWHPIRTQNLYFLYQQSFGADKLSASLVPSLLRESPRRTMTVQELLDRQVTAAGIAYAVFFGLALADLHRPFGSRTQILFRGNHGL